MNFDKEKIAQALRSAYNDMEMEEAKIDDAIFHMVDWLDDLDQWNEFCRAPDSLSPSDLGDLVVGFVAHVPAHLFEYKHAQPCIQQYDTGYPDWTGPHSGRFFVNARSRFDSNHVILHKASCPSKKKIVKSGPWLVNELYKTPFDAQGVEQVSKQTKV